MLVEEIMKVAKSRDPPLNLGFDQGSKSLPDKLWCLYMLSTLEPTHKFFAKDYRPPPRVRNSAITKSLNNDDGFFDGL